MSDSMRRFVRGALQILSGGVLGTLANQLVLDTPDRYDPYVIMLGSVLTTMAWLALEAMSGRDIIVSRTTTKNLP